MNRIKSPLTNIMEIMDIVIKRIETNGLDETGRDPMVSKLLEKGFRLDDIETAMNLVSMMTSRVNPLVRVGARDFQHDGSPIGVRHLHASEAIRLSADAQQMLLKAVEDGVISQLHFEKVVEYIWKNDLRQVSLTRIELIILITKPEAEIETEHDADAIETIPHSLMMH
ncbi:MAG: hypothetical protein PWR01_3036 [Clostridiales bacterium]|nr:hypothetical protein [Clostridiales bacterium]MDN5281963.1 hypothetical protein [Candidatus Ozemobacter sp.]